MGEHGASGAPVAAVARRRRPGRRPRRGGVPRATPPAPRRHDRPAAVQPAPRHAAVAAPGARDRRRPASDPATTRQGPRQLPALSPAPAPAAPRAPRPAVPAGTQVTVENLDNGHEVTCTVVEQPHRCPNGQLDHGRHRRASTSWATRCSRRSPSASPGDALAGVAAVELLDAPRAGAEACPRPELRRRSEHRAPHRPAGRGRPRRPRRGDRRRPRLAHPGAGRDRARRHRRGGRPRPGAGAARGGRAARRAGRRRRRPPPRLDALARSAATAGCSSPTCPTTWPRRSSPTCSTACRPSSGCS